MTNSVVGRVIDQLGIEHSLIKRWKDDEPFVNGSSLLPSLGGVK